MLENECGKLKKEQKTNEEKVKIKIEIEVVGENCATADEN